MTRRQLLRSLIVLSASITLVFVFDFTSLAAEFSADMIQQMTGQTITGKVFVKGKKTRMEMNTPGGKVITIVLPDEGKTLMLRPEDKMYMEMPTSPFGSSPSVVDEKLEEMATKKHLGTEKVNGYLCEKYKFIYHDKSKGKMTQWFSKKLGYPVKMIYQGQHGEVTTEYKNIKEGRVMDSQFQVPAGYQKMQIPGMSPGTVQP
jgi:outer membrane lipoprotein-sorting protein